jgi:hypothetical protein
VIELEDSIELKDQVILFLDREQQEMKEELNAKIALKDLTILDLVNQEM